MPRKRKKKSQYSDLEKLIVKLQKEAYNRKQTEYNRTTAQSILKWYLVHKEITPAQWRLAEVIVSKKSKARI